MMHPEPKTVCVLHGAGYIGGAIIEQVVKHPSLVLAEVTSNAYAGRPIPAAHPGLKGVVDDIFAGEPSRDILETDVVISCAGHGSAASEIAELISAGFDGVLVDMSGDYRLKDAALYPEWYGFDHPAAHLLDSFVYGLTELNSDILAGARRIANPGCFATGLALSVAPIASLLNGAVVHATALTGASGSGVRPSSTTHFPTRDGNVRAYKVYRHQHLVEIDQVLPEPVAIAFVPVSAPWTRGIWGCLQVEVPHVEKADVAHAYRSHYEVSPMVRLWENELPELRVAVGTPFCDIGWMQQDSRLVIAFALDNLLKGAASQAIQNINASLDYRPTDGLLPDRAESITHGPV